MLQHRIAIAALAAVFGFAATTSAFVAGSTRPAYADDEHGDHHDNGRHHGERRHHNGDDEDERGDDRDRGRFGGDLRGTIVGINGATLSLRLNDGRIVTVNDQAALNTGNAPNLFVGEAVRVRGTFQNGTFFASRISARGNANGAFNNNNNNNCNPATGGLVTVSGFERGGFDGNSFTLRQQIVNGIPIGTDYTIIVNGSTCVQRALGSNGEHVTVVGVPLNDGHTIQAVRITG